jgi:hypothetical protein
VWGNLHSTFGTGRWRILCVFSEDDTGKPQRNSGGLHPALSLISAQFLGIKTAKITAPISPCDLREQQLPGPSFVSGTKVKPPDFHIRELVN